MIQGVAHSTGRFAPPSEMPIFVAPEIKQGKPVKVKAQGGQLDIFSEMGDQEEF